MPIIPFAIQCTIHENQLLALKDSVYGRLDSDFVSNIPGFKYCLSIYPNGDDDARRGQVWIGLYLELGKVKKVETDFSVFLESADYSFEIQHIYDESYSWGDVLCKTEDFFNPEKQFIVDGKFTIKIDGIFKFETNNDPTFEQQKWNGGELGNGLWEEDDNKNFTIIVDGKEIKVHKLVLKTRSKVFKAMFNPKSKKYIKNKVEIIDFTYNAAETAVKMMYNCNFTSSLSLDEMMLLLQFFDKYQIPSLKDKVELLLINQISAATVCRLTNASIISNSMKLQTKCIKFLEKSFALKIPLTDIEILDYDVLVELVRNSFYKIVEPR